MTENCSTSSTVRNASDVVWRLRVEASNFSGAITTVPVDSGVHDASVALIGEVETDDTDRRLDTIDEAWLSLATDLMLETCVSPTGVLGDRRRPTRLLRRKMEHGNFRRMHLVHAGLSVAIAHFSLLERQRSQAFTTMVSGRQHAVEQIIPEEYDGCRSGREDMKKEWLIFPAFPRVDREPRDQRVYFPFWEWLL